MKPQGSLEKSREEREVKKNTDINTTECVPKNSESIRSKRAKQNVVLQSIFKKMEENKQVCVYLIFCSSSAFVFVFVYRASR